MITAHVAYLAPTTENLQPQGSTNTQSFTSSIHAKPSRFRSFSFSTRFSTISYVSILEHLRQAESKQIRINVPKGTHPITMHSSLLRSLVACTVTLCLTATTQLNETHGITIQPNTTQANAQDMGIIYTCSESDFGGDCVETPFLRNECCRILPNLHPLVSAIAD